MQLTKEQQEAEYAKSPSKKRAELKRDVITHGLNSGYVLEAIDNHDKLLKMIDESQKSGTHLAGDSYTLVDAATIPYILRLELLKLSKLWDRYPGVAKWWERVKHRPSTDEAIWSRMSEADWAPFKSIADDPWPKVKDMVKAA
jgi:glutathione S-transferase